jgi:hypothetical protein
LAARRVTKSMKVGVVLPEHDAGWLCQRSRI